jgi:hypothetical protein
MKRIIFGAVLAVSLFAWNPSQAQDQNFAEKKSSAVIAVHNWLALVDAGSYGESWDEASSLFKQSLTREQWAAAIAAARDPLGAVMNRQLVSTSFQRTMPGAPDGEYVIIVFTTNFGNKQLATETITPMLDADGQWRVSGYYIK